MSQHDPTVSLRQMRAYAMEALEVAKHRKRGDLERQRLLRYSLIHLVSVVGEAARRVPEDFRACHKEVQWTDIVGMRNHLVHGYDAIELEYVWKVVKEDLPALVKQLDGILAD